MRRTLLLAPLLLAACASNPATRQATITVVDSQGAALEGVPLRTDPVHPEHPLDIEGYFRGETGPLGRWTTGPKGQATILLLRDHPTALTLFLPGTLVETRMVYPFQTPSKITIGQP